MRLNPFRSSSSRRPAFTACGLSMLLLASACGSDGDGDEAEADGSTEAAAETTAATESADPPEETAAPDEAAPEETAPATEEGGGTIIVTSDDGTVYEFTDVSSCDTSATSPDSLPLTNGYELSGRTADGAFSIFVGRAGFDDDGAVFSGGLEGDFDDEGRNAKMLYVLDTEETGLQLAVDGATVAGTIDARAVAPTRPHGDDTTLTIEASC